MCTVDCAIVSVPDSSYGTSVIGGATAVVAMAGEAVGRAWNGKCGFLKRGIMELVAGTIMAYVTARGTCVPAVVINTGIGRVNEDTCEFTASVVVAVGTVTCVARWKTEVCPVLTVVVETA